VNGLGVMEEDSAELEALVRSRASGAARLARAGSSVAAAADELRMAVEEANSEGASLSLASKKKKERHRRGRSFELLRQITAEIKDDPEADAVFASGPSVSTRSLLPAVLDVAGAQGQRVFDPYLQSFEGAVMFVDISNFSVVSDLLCAIDARGPEHLVNFLNTWLTQVVRLVAKAGGDVVKFAGDAAITVWPVDDDSQSLRVAVQRAVQCALDIQDTLPAVDIIENLQWGLKVGIGAGMISLAHLGGTQKYRHREYFAIGPAVLEAFYAEKEARAKGDVICSAFALESGADAFFEFEDVSSEFVRILRQTGFIKKKRTVREIPFAAMIGETTDLMRMYLPDSVFAYDESLTRMEGGTDWLSELRRISVAFIHLGYSSDQFMLSLDPQQMHDLHRCICEIQNAVHDYDGSVNKVNLDDKGLTCIAVFGLPRETHEDDATRSVLSSLRIVSVLESQFHLRPSIGITSDLCYVGFVGHPSARREYTVIGDAVNLAARFMQEAKTNVYVRVLVDNRTRGLVRDEIEFAMREREIKVKGKLEKIKVFAPLSLNGRSSVIPRWSASFGLDSSSMNTMSSGAAPANIDWQNQWRSQVSRYGAKFVDNVKHFRLKLIHAGAVSDSPPVFLSHQFSNRNNVVTVISGGIGSGKSHALALIHRRLSPDGESSENVVLAGAANPFEKGSLERSHAIWIDLLHGILQFKDADESIRSWLQRANSSLFQEADLLIEEICPSATSSSGRTSSQMRRERFLTDVIVDVLKGFSLEVSQEGKLGVTILIDDAHHLDRGSWTVIERFMEISFQGIFVILALNTQNEHLHVEAKTLLESPLVKYEKIPPLMYGEVATLVRSELDVLSFPEELVDLVALVSNGNPLFAKELLADMTGKGILSTDHVSKVCEWGADLPFNLDEILAENDGMGIAPVATEAKHKKVLGKLEKFVAERYERFIRHEKLVQDGTTMRGCRSSRILVGLKLNPPASLACVLGTWLDILSLRQIVLLKIASHSLAANNHRYFHQKVVLGAMLLIDKTASIDEVFADFNILIQRDFVSVVDDVPSNQYSFVHWLMPHVLRMRTVSTQRVVIMEALIQAQDKHDEHIRNRFLRKTWSTLDKGVPFKQGFVLVHKNNAPEMYVADSHGDFGKKLLPPKEKAQRFHRRRNSHGSSWKKRYACLFTDRIDFFSDESCSRKSGALYLESASCFENRSIGSRDDVFRVHATGWEKHDDIHQGEERIFFVSPWRTEDTKDWLYKIRFAIQAASGKFQHQGPKDLGNLEPLRFSQAKNRFAPRRRSALPNFFSKAFAT